MMTGSDGASFFRPRNILLGLLFFVIAAAIYPVIATILHMNAEPNVAVDYRAKHRALATRMAGVPEGHGLAEWAKLVALLATVNETIHGIEFQLRKNDAEPRWRTDGPEIHFALVLRGPKIRDGMGREREAVNLMRTAGVFDGVSRLMARSPLFNDRPVTDIMIHDHMPELGHGRQFAYARLASSRMALEDGDVSEALRAIDDCLGLAHTFGYQDRLMAYLVGASIQHMALAELRAQLLERQFDEQECRALLDSLEDRRMPPLSLAMRSEHGTLMDFVQRCYSDNGSGNGFIIPERLSDHVTPGFDRDSTSGSFAAAFVARFLYEDRRTTVELFDRFMQPVIENADRTMKDVRPVVTQWQLDFDRATDGRRRSMAGMVGAVEGPLESSAISRMEYDGTVLMVALEVFRAVHSGDPKSLGELVPEILPALPTDAIHGGAFGYRVLDEPDEHGRTYLLYSTGLDMTDDGGSEVDWDRSPSVDGPGPYEAVRNDSLRGYDYVINQPREEW